MLWEPQSGVTDVSLCLRCIIDIYLNLVTMPIVIIWILSIVLWILHVSYFLPHLLSLARFWELNSHKSKDGRCEHTHHDDDNELSLIILLFLNNNLLLLWFCLNINNLSLSFWV